MIAAIFQEHNFKTGLYTSPHLKDFRERIKINGIMISEDFVVDFLERTLEISEEIKPSFFELTFVMALDYFYQQKVDIAIIETGLGGRLDSTNVITPLLSIITNIGFDHMDILGDSLEKIASEKAGIIKENVPVVIGETTEKTKPVFENKAKESNAPISFAEEKYQVVSNNYSIKNLEIIIEDKENQNGVNYFLDLNGLYQQKNLPAVLLAVDVLKNKFSFEEKKVHSGLNNVKLLTGLHGRWEIIHEKPIVVLDVAHNEDGIKQLVHQIQQSVFDELHIVFGMVKDKDIEKVLVRLPEKAKYYFTKAQIPRALDERELQNKALNFHLTGETFPTVNEAVKAALTAASTKDMIIVCGSVFVVGEVDAL
jgi:dihydrofolate synthase/folylpolyglutamate synthase